MSQQDKARYFKQLKAAGVEFSKHYREYTEAELKAGVDKIVEEQPDLAVQLGIINAPPAEQPADFGIAGPTAPIPPAPAPNDGFGDTPVPDFDIDALNAAYANATGRPVEPNPGPDALGPAPAESVRQGYEVPVRERDPNEMAGARQNSQPEGVPIRVDELGREWYQEEVRKPAYPAPRGRRVLKYEDPGVQRQRVQVGDYVEEFEVAGVGQTRTSEVKITLPSYQVGIYKDPRFPFKVHVYNGVEAFDLMDVQNYWGGAELVPTWVKRTYVENDLCYDIRSVVQTINDEYRQLQLEGRI